MSILARAFQERGSLFLPLFASGSSKPLQDRYRAAGLPVCFLDLVHFRLRTLLRLAWLVLRHRIQVVHWNFFPALRNGYMWGLSLLTPWVDHYYNDRISRTAPAVPPPSGLKRLLKRLLLRRYRKVTCVSQYVRDCLEQEGSWSEVQVCLHRINTDRFAPNASSRAEVRQRLGAEKDQVLLVVGQLILAKGLDVALRALALLPPSVKLWVIGAGEDGEALRRMAEALGVADRVLWLGLQPQVQSYMQAADVFVFPSRWAEAAGLVGLEAQACGLPLLASRVGGIPEYMRDGSTGFLFPPDDHRALADLARRLLGDDELRFALGQQARAWVVEHFSLGSHLRDYLALYSSPSPARGPALPHSKNHKIES